MASKNIIVGTTLNLFEPDRKITLAEFTAMTLKAIDELNMENIDYTLLEWYSVYLTKAAEIWIITADANGQFSPHENLIRGCHHCKSTCSYE